MARPRKQTYTLKRYLDDIKEGYVSNDADTQRNPAWKTIIDGLAVTVLTDDYIPSIILAEEDSGQMHIVDGGSRTAALNMIIYGIETIMMLQQFRKSSNGLGIRRIYIVCLGLSKVLICGFMLSVNQPMVASSPNLCQNQTMTPTSKQPSLE